MSDLGSQLLGVRTPRKSPSGLSSRRSRSSLRGSGSLAQDLGGAENDAASRFTLAHELAAALSPDDNASSRLLADEFGIELEEEEQEPSQPAEQVEPTVNGDYSIPVTIQAVDEPISIASSRRLSSVASERPEVPTIRKPSPPATFEQDPFLLLNQSLKSNELFINQLKRLDSEAQPSSTTGEPTIEDLATDIIRRIDETTREREQQVRELLGYDREFRKIAEEINGNDVLGDLEELERIEGLVDETDTVKDAADLLDPEHLSSQLGRPVSGAWEDAPDPHSLDALEEEEEEEEDDYYEAEEPTTPAKDAFLPPSPPSTGPSTPSSTLPHFAYMRTITQSLVSSLSTISEHAQVNGAATAEAGRKIRALKNKLGTWRTESEEAEKSRTRVEKWEAGVWEENPGFDLTLASSPRESKRIDSRKLVEEELRAFSVAIQEAGVKTKAIMDSK